MSKWLFDISSPFWFTKKLNQSAIQVFSHCYKIIFQNTIWIISSFYIMDMLYKRMYIIVCNTLPWSDKILRTGKPYSVPFSKRYRNHSKCYILTHIGGTSNAGHFRLMFSFPYISLLLWLSSKVLTLPSRPTAHQTQNGLKN